MWAATIHKGALAPQSLFAEIWLGRPSRSLDGLDLAGILSDSL